jgi:hypothetical protein
MTKNSDATKVEANIKDWLSLVLSMIAGGLGFEEDICGAVLSVRNWGISITIWNRDSHNHEQISQVSERLKNLMGVDYVRYQPHQTSLKRIGQKPGPFHPPNSHRGQKQHANVRTRSQSHPQLPHQQQQQQPHGKQPKKKVERALSAPAVLPSTPKASRQQSQPTSSNKKEPQPNQQNNKKRRGKKAQQAVTKEAPQTNHATSDAASPSSSVSSNLSGVGIPGEGKQPTKRTRHHKRKGTAKGQDQSRAVQDSAGVVPQKLADFVKPLTSLDKIGISLLIGATITAMYIL